LQGGYPEKPKGDKMHPSKKRTWRIFMIQLPIAIIADIHANIWALDTILQDIKRRSIIHIINLGDSVYGPLAPAETAERILSEQILNIQGNEDRILYDPAPAPTPTVLFSIQNLHPTHLEWLRSLPKTLLLNETIFACHGTPTSDETYLLEIPSLHGSTLASSEHISSLLGPISQPIILCAHTHIARVVSLPDGRLIINPGSVGVPAYEDDFPFPHKMEMGSPHARYAILSQIEGSYSIEQVTLPYDWQTASATARKNGREDWAHWLALGRA
jgi:predicted phosphodiesterase